MSTPVHEINQKQISQNLAFHCQKKTQTHTHTHTHTPGTSAANSFFFFFFISAANSFVSYKLSN